MKEKKIIYYTDELNDEFSSAKITPIKIDGNYKYNRNTLWDLCSLIVQNVLSMPIKIGYAKIKFKIKYIGKEKLKNYNGSVYKIDARTISMEALGKYFPNTPMLAAIVKVSNIMTEQEFLDDMIGSFKHKFAKKPEVIDGNMKALQMALEQITKVK